MWTRPVHQRQQEEGIITRLTDQQRDSIAATSARGSFDPSGLRFPTIDTLTGSPTVVAGQAVLISATATDVASWVLDPGDGQAALTTAPPWNVTYPRVGKVAAVATAKGPNGADQRELGIEVLPA